MTETMTEAPAAYGAAPVEWASAIAAALTPRLLPCVCDPCTTPARGSKIEASKAAKVPSVMRGKRTFSGISGWNRRPAATSGDLAKWQSRPEHGILCRTGAMSGAEDVVYALDADIDDADEASLVFRCLCQTLGCEAAPVRCRGGSARWACLIREPGGVAAGKRLIEMRSGCVEILGSGGQLALAGTHPSGTRYAWQMRSVASPQATASDGPAVIDAPAGSVDRIVEALSVLSTGKTTGAAERPARQIGESYEAADPLADWLRTSDAVEVLCAHPDGRLDIRCPWSAEHTGGGADDKPQDATYFPAGSYGYAHGGFRCLHAHSGAGGHERTTAELRAWARDHGWSGELAEDELPDMSARVTADASVPGGDAPPDGLLGRAELEQRLEAAGWRTDSGKIEPTVDSVALAMMCPALVGVEIRRDCFLAATQTRTPGGTWQPVSNTLVTDIRRRLERFGFKARGLGFDLIDRSLELVAEHRKMDSMIEHLADFAPAWDGVPRWRELLAVRCFATDAPDYLAAVGEYIGATLWARATCADPDGVKADIVPVLVGAQGTRKSTLVGVLAMDERWRADLDLSQDDVEIIRKMRGRVTAEIPELVGLGKRAETAVKAFLSQPYDDVRPLYRSHVERSPRRCLIMMTTNNRTFLSDPTGNRRFAPVHVGAHIDIDAVRADLPQLWAEGRELVAALSPIERMREVERLSESAVESATVMTAEDDVIAWQVAKLREAERVPGYSRPPLTMAVIQSRWLGWQKAPGRGGTARELGGRLQRAGMVSVRRMVPAPGGGLMRVTCWEIDGCAPVDYTLPPAEKVEANPFSDAAS